MVWYVVLGIVIGILVVGGALGLMAELENEQEREKEIKKRKETWRLKYHCSECGALWPKDEYNRHRPDCYCCEGCGSVEYEKVPSRQEGDKWVIRTTFEGTQIALDIPTARTLEGVK